MSCAGVVMLRVFHFRRNLQNCHGRISSKGATTKSVVKELKVNLVPMSENELLNFFNWGFRVSYSRPKFKKNWGREFLNF